MKIAETTLTIGSNVTCTDGACGTVSKIVIDPIAETVTHLVVEPAHRTGLGRLVALAIADTSGDEVELSCTRAEFDNLEAAEETQFLPGTSGGYSGFGPGQAMLWPYYGLGDGGMTSGLAMGSVIPPVTVVDTLPPGEVAIRRGDGVHATDGEIGNIEGLVIDSGSHHATHVLLQEGHLWGRKTVTIPINKTDRRGGRVEVALTKQEIGDLPAITLSKA